MSRTLDYDNERKSRSKAGVVKITLIASAIVVAIGGVGLIALLRTAPGPAPTTRATAAGPKLGDPLVVPDYLSILDSFERLDLVAGRSPTAKEWYEAVDAVDFELRRSEIDGKKRDALVMVQLRRSLIGYQTAGLSLIAIDTIVASRSRDVDDELNRIKQGKEFRRSASEARGIVLAVRQQIIDQQK